MATDTGGMVLKLGLVGAAGYLAYRYFFSGVVVNQPAQPGGGGAPAASGGAGAGALASIFTRLASRASRDGLSTASPDQWNVLYLAEGGPGPAPDPIAVFGNRESMSLAQYWAGMSAWLSANKGLTGLGVYTGLYRLARGGRLR